MENVNSEIIIIVVASIISLWVIFYFIPIGYWFQALVSGVEVSLLELIFMKFRKVPLSRIVPLLIKAAKAGVAINSKELEALYLSGRNIDNIIDGLSYARLNNIDLTLKDATTLDLEKKRIVSELSETK